MRMKAVLLMALLPLAACQPSQATLDRDGGQCEVETMRRYPNDHDENDSTVPNSAGPSMTFMQACMEAKGHKLILGKNLCDWATHPNDLFSGNCYE